MNWRVKVAGQSSRQSDLLVGAGYACWEAACYAMVSRVIPFGVAGRVGFVLPITILCCLSGIRKVWRERDRETNAR